MVPIVLHRQPRQEQEENKRAGPEGHEHAGGARLRQYGDADGGDEEDPDIDLQAEYNRRRRTQHEQRQARAVPVGEGENQGDHDEEHNDFLRMPRLVGEQDEGIQGHELCGEGEGDTSRYEHHEKAQYEDGRQPDDERLQADGVVGQRHVQQTVDDPIVEVESRAVEDRHVVVDPVPPKEIADADHDVSFVVMKLEPGEEMAIGERETEREGRKLHGDESEQARGRRTLRVGRLFGYVILDRDEVMSRSSL